MHETYPPHQTVSKTQKYEEKKHTNMKDNCSLVLDQTFALISASVWPYNLQMHSSTFTYLSVSLYFATRGKVLS